MSLQTVPTHLSTPMWRRPAVWLFRYLLSFLAIGLALLVQGALMYVLPKGFDFPFAFLYLIAVFTVAWFGGYWQGIGACLLTMVGIPLLAVHSFRLSKVDLSRLAPLIGISVAISALADAQRRRREALHKANEELDRRVQNRTQDLAQSVQALEAEIEQRKNTEHKLETQLERLRLLDQITRAIGERQDLGSVFQVVVRTLEDNLPIDFGSICLYDPAAAALSVTCVGVRSEALTAELAMRQNSTIAVDLNGLSRCVEGHLVYEPDLSELNFPFPQRLSRMGMGSVVAAPLVVEKQVFGVLIAARRMPNSFSSGDCEFLRQLSEHVALASGQAQVLTELHRACDDLRETQQKVMQQERLRAIGQMASGIAHDINNAISPISLYTDLLLEREPNLSSRTRDYLVTTQRAIGDVAHTVARMREFYRRPEPESILMPVDLGSLVQQVLQLTRARWHDMPMQRGIVIQSRMDLAVDLPAVAGIESEIREALTNLVFNAVDAMPEGGTLTIRTKTKPGASNLRRVCIEVIDTGIGMDEDTQRRCLEPFFTTKGERGTGLGLGMVYGVMQRHSAEIEIESGLGKGTIVRLSFPVRGATGTNQIEPEVPQLAPARLRILIVDDDPLLIRSFREALESEGHTIVTARGGQEGIDAFQTSLTGDQPFAAVITDLGMPYVDGRKVACAIKQACASVPVILLTGWGERLIAEGDLPPHVDRVMSKPPKLRDLRNALTELTEGNRNGAAARVQVTTAETR